MTPFMQTAFTRLHDESYKPEFRGFLERDVKQGIAEINKHLDSWDKSRTLDKNDNKK